VPIDILTAFMDRGVPLVIPSISSGDAPAVEPEVEPEVTSESEEEEQG
jgi:hypothetical protein